MEYDDIVTALNRGFYLDNLNEIAGRAQALLDSDTPLRHPAAVYMVAATAQKVAAFFEGQPVRDETAAVIEAHVRPKMAAVLSAAETEADAQSLVRALDDLARAYVDALPFLKSIGT